MLSSDVKKKLKWVFNMYDIDGNGFIDKQEMIFMMRVSVSIVYFCGYEEYILNVYFNFFLMLLFDVMFSFMRNFLKFILLFLFVLKV